MNKKTLACLIPMLTSAGCATMVKPSAEALQITSTPPGAEFVITDKRGQVAHSGHTPATVTLEKSNGYFEGAMYTVTCTKPGYTPAKEIIDTKISNWYFGNLLLGMPGVLLGMVAIDPHHGGMWRFDKETANVTLSPEASR